MNSTAGWLSPRMSAHHSAPRLVALVLGLVVFGSCQNGPEDAPAVDSRQFQDVAVPDGFRLRDRHHESWSREEASWRRGHFVYVGRTSIDDAAAYVLQRMPHHSWNLLEEGTSSEAGKSLRFQRGIYAADYLITHQEGVTRMVVEYTTDYSQR